MNEASGLKTRTPTSSPCKASEKLGKTVRLLVRIQLAPLKKNIKGIVYKACMSNGNFDKTPIHTRVRIPISPLRKMRALCYRFSRIAF